jgi:hypothetical protein
LQDVVETFLNTRTSELWPVAACPWPAVTANWLKVQAETAFALEVEVVPTVERFVVEEGMDLFPPLQAAVARATPAIRPMTILRFADILGSIGRLTSGAGNVYRVQYGTSGVNDDRKFSRRMPSSIAVLSVARPVRGFGHQKSSPLGAMFNSR